MNGQPKRSLAQKLVVGIPYAWLIAFFLVPFLIVLKISLSQTAIAQPPYTPVLDLAAGWHGIENFFAGLSLDNYVLLGSDPLYLLSYVKSLEIAAFSTLILLVIGYPIAYGIARTPRRLQAVLVLLVVLPFWTSFLIRIYAWMNILQHDGPLNQVLMALHIVREPPVWLADRYGHLYRHRLFLPAVHGAAALCDAGETGRVAALRRRPISAARAGRRSGWSPCRCRRPACWRACCCASFRSSANSSFPICSAARRRR